MPLAVKAPSIECMSMWRAHAVLMAELVVGPRPDLALAWPSSSTVLVVSAHAAPDGPARTSSGRGCQRNTLSSRSPCRWVSLMTMAPRSSSRPNRRSSSIASMTGIGIVSGSREMRAADNVYHAAGIDRYTCRHIVSHGITAEERGNT